MRASVGQFEIAFVAHGEPRFAGEVFAPHDLPFAVFRIFHRLLSLRVGAKIAKNRYLCFAIGYSAVPTTAVSGGVCRSGPSGPGKGTAGIREVGGCHLFSKTNRNFYGIPCNAPGRTGADRRPDEPGGRTRHRVHRTDRRGAVYGACRRDCSASRPEQDRRAAERQYPQKRDGRWAFPVRG